jgi:hypothetical protein
MKSSGAMPSARTPTTRSAMPYRRTCSSCHGTNTSSIVTRPIAPSAASSDASPKPTTGIPTDDRISWRNGSWKCPITTAS